jgi:tRNA pseudouridine55 synthase
MKRRTSRRKKAPEKPGPAGFLVVDKPPGVTSHDVVDAARKWLGTRRVGHLGTLDPQATGVLPLAVREATKLIPFMEQGLKSYRGVVRFGIETDTLDAEGAVTRSYEGALPGKEEVEAALGAFRGEIEQIPPMYSAVKKDGVPLHRLARKGEEVEREPKRVHIHRLELARYEETESELVVDCSPGTYVRVLASDLGERLGCGAHLRCLRRLRSGPFDTSHALTAEQLGKEAEEGVVESRLIPPAEVMGLPVLTLSEDGTRRVLNGGDVSPGARLRVSPGDRVLMVDAAERLLAIGELRPDRRLWPLRVFGGESR